MTAPLSIRNITKTFGDFKALNDVSLEIAAGEFIVLLGPSGCGKTTLLSILGGFLSPTSGQIFIHDKDVTHVQPAKRPTTTMFQDYALFPHMRLIDNVGFGLRMRGMGRGERDTKALTLLDMVGLKTASSKKPHELSGGQRQRVALARALAVDPDVLLLDEPLGALDLKLRRQMQDELKSIQRRIGTTFVHVTHDQEEAMAIADRIIVMNSGRIEDAGSPTEIYVRPKSLFSAGFMGEVNFVEGVISGSPQGGKMNVQTPLGSLGLPLGCFVNGAPAQQQKVTLCIRPEHFRKSENPSEQLVSLGSATIANSAFFGTHFRCHLVPTLGDSRTLTGHMATSENVRDGAIVPLAVQAKDIVVLPSKEAA